MKGQQMDARLPAAYPTQVGEEGSQPVAQTMAGNYCCREVDTGKDTGIRCDAALARPGATLPDGSRLDQADRSCREHEGRRHTPHLPLAELRRQVGVRWPAEAFYVHISKVSGALQVQQAPQ